MSDSPQKIGGLARAEALSPEARRSIATRAAKARWQTIQAGLPEASHQGQLKIGDIELEVYVLEDGRRLFHKRGMARALGLKSEGGNAFMRTISRKGLASEIDAELRLKIESPIIFKSLSSDPAHGYTAETLIEVCDALIRARNENKLAPSQDFLAVQAEMIIRSAAKVGIYGLIDEATGYIDNKRKDEYRELFSQFLREEFRQWEKEFPEKFFEMIYRLYGLKRKDPNSVKRPGFFGKFIRRYIYHPLANSNGAILKELDERNPIVYAGGGRKYRFHQFLTDQIGLPAFRQHLWQVVGIGNSVSDRKQFERAFYRAFPEAAPLGRAEQLELFSEDTTSK